MNPVRTIIFDAYGTLFDVYKIQETLERHYPGQGEDLSQKWRNKQLEYSWLRTLIRSYVDFDQVTKDALLYTLDAEKLIYKDQVVEELMAAYLTVPLYSEVHQALASLKPLQLVILSNGTSASLEQAIVNTGLDTLIDDVMSVDVLSLFKPHPTVYETAQMYLNVPKEEILFVSSNGWDIAGAKSYGWTVAWINRKGLPVERLGVTPDFIVSSLLELPIIQIETQED